ncbi:hypothetical protein H0H92_013127 [Tricholoma furcatifolium]|nr:hypothetical protein H0H92_013127 [Tricholoma furcatifolium]
MENVGMRKALCYLSKKTWGNGWEKCLEAFVNFEKEKGYPQEDGRLVTDGRPVIISSWIRGGRRWEDMPIDDGFAGSWSVWWTNVKNSGRDKFAKGGANGLLLVMVGLAWWGNHIEEIGRSSKGTDSWAWAVDDVRLTIDALSQDLKEGKSGEGGTGGVESDEEDGEEGNAPQTAVTTRKAQNNKRKTAEKEDKGMGDEDDTVHSKRQRSARVAKRETAPTAKTKASRVGKGRVNKKK